MALKDNLQALRMPLEQLKLHQEGTKKIPEEFEQIN